MGRAIAESFAAAGASVVAADIDKAGGDETTAAIGAAGGIATFVHTDVADSRSVAAMVRHAVDTYGTLDAAVNAAAIEGENGPLADLDDDVFDRIQRVNVYGIYNCMKHEIRAMLPNGRGAIVNFASTNAFRPQPRQTAYTTSKHAVLGMTKAAAIDYAGKGIRINAIAPGSIDTPMLRNARARRKNGDEADTIARLSLIGRFGTVQEIANAAMFLCSDEASFVIGHTLAVDAGYLAR